MAKPDVIIFDWDNTLVDTWPIIHEALYHTFVKMGVEPWTIETVKKRVARSMRDAFPEIFGSNWQAASKIYQEEYRAINLKKLKSLPGSEATLKLLKEKSIKCVIVSNKRGNNLRNEVEYLKWNDYFVGLVGSDDAARDKPSRDPVLYALKPLGLEPNPNCWFVGDSVIDLECAQNTNCSAIFYGDAHKVEGEPGSYICEGFKVWDKVLDQPALLAFFKQNL